LYLQWTNRPNSPSRIHSILFIFIYLIS
jgi:hypothetical protein